MKKVLLMLVALVATVTASAKEEFWEKGFSPVAKQADLAGVHTAVASDGSVYASSTYDQAFTIGDVSVAAPEDNMLSSCIVKFDKNGNGLWAVALTGGYCTVNALVADTDGSLYVTGSFMDEALLCGGLSATGSSSAYSAFVAKISSLGNVEALKSFTPQVDETIGSLMGDPWDEGYEMPLYQSYFPMEVTPNAIKVDGNKVYVAALFKGDVPSLSWEGRYLNSWGLYQDIATRGIFSLNKSDLSAPTSIVNVGSDCLDYVLEGEEAYTVDALNFVVKDGKIYIAFFGWGNLILETATESKKFSFSIGQNVNEHALVLSDLSDVQNKTREFRAPDMKTAPWSEYFNIVDAELAGDNVILGGTFYGQLPLDNSKYSPVEDSGDARSLDASFVASVKLSDCSVNWAVANVSKSEATSMVVIGDEVHASTEAANYTFDLTTGTLKETGDIIFEDMDVYNNQYFGGISIEPEVAVEDVVTTPAKVIVKGASTGASGINETKTLKNAAAKYYNVNGVELSAPQKGLNIIKTTDGVKKVTVK